MSLRTKFNPMGSNIICPNQEQFYAADSGNSFVYKNKNNVGHYIYGTVSTSGTAPTSLTVTSEIFIPNIVGGFFVAPVSPVYTGSSAFYYFDEDSNLYCIANGGSPTTLSLSSYEINLKDIVDMSFDANNRFYIQLKNGNIKLVNLQNSTVNTFMNCSQFKISSRQPYYTTVLAPQGGFVAASSFSLGCSSSSYYFDSENDIVYYSSSSSNVATKLVSDKLRHFGVNWTRPNLTSNGTLGGDSFAVKAVDYNNPITGSGISNAYMAVDNNIYSSSVLEFYGGSSTSTYINYYRKFIIYSPEKINISKLVVNFKNCTNTYGSPMDNLGLSAGNTEPTSNQWQDSSVIMGQVTISDTQTKAKYDSYAKTITITPDTYSGFFNYFVLTFRATSQYSRFNELYIYGTKLMEI